MNDRQKHVADSRETSILITMIPQMRTGVPLMMRATYDFLRHGVPAVFRKFKDDFFR